MSTTAETRTRIPLPELLDLGEFTLLLHDETIESGAPLAKQIRESIVAAFAKLDPVLSLVYELEIDETEVSSSSRKSKHPVRLKRKKGTSLLQKLVVAVSAFGFVVGVLSADYDKIPENIEKACQTVVADCKLRGKNVEIPEKHFPPVDPNHPTQQKQPPDDQSA